MLLVAFINKFSGQWSKSFSWPNPHKVLGNPTQALPVYVIKTVRCSKRKALQHPSSTHCAWLKHMHTHTHLTKSNTSSNITIVSWTNYLPCGRNGSILL